MASKRTENRKETNGSDPRRSGSKTTATVEYVRTGPSGEVWRVAGDGEDGEVITTKTSAAVLDEATRIYQRALKSLADK